jgi:hypothetical protein
MSRVSIAFLAYGAGLVLAMVSPLPAVAATISAADCSASAVQTAISRAADGDTVVIPPGTCTWSSAVTLDATSRNLTVKGSGTGQTLITAGVAPVLSIVGRAGYVWRLGELSMRATGAGQTVVQVNGSATKWRVYDIRFTDTGTPLFLFTVSGETFGVLDRLSVTGGNSGIVNVIGGGFQAWANRANANWGDDRAVFLENSDIVLSDFNQGRFTIDCENGGRYVLRNNRITNQRTGNHGLDTGGYASCLSAEIYNNRFTYTSAWNVIDAVIYWRGGTAVFHNNVFNYSSATWGSNHIRLPNFRAGDGSVGWPACNGTAYRFNSTTRADWLGTVGFGTSGTQKMCSGDRMRLCTGDSECSAAGAGACSESVDGQGGSGAYPCFMQVGRGVGNMSSPVYEWNNTFSGGQGQGGFSCPGGGCDANMTGGALVQANRDYFNDTMRPGYAPYVYPHPLTQGSTTPPPSAPTNLRSQ